MAEKEKEKVEEIPWTPDKPLADEDDENECQRRARGEARKAYLLGTYAKDPKEGEKKPKDGKKRPLFS